MTQQEFDSVNWRAGAQVRYRGGDYGVVSVNFYEKLLGVVFGKASGDDSSDDLIWVRCENVELVK